LSLRERDKMPLLAQRFFVDILASAGRKAGSFHPMR
jgi:hypothetical protein